MTSINEHEEYIKIDHGCGNIHLFNIQVLSHARISYNSIVSNNQIKVLENYSGTYPIKLLVRDIFSNCIGQTLRDDISLGEYQLTKQDDGSFLPGIGPRDEATIDLVLRSFYPENYKNNAVKDDECCIIL